MKCSETRIYLNNQEYILYECNFEKTIDEFLKGNKAYFYDERLKIPNFLPDEGIFKKYYERNSSISAKIKEDAAVWVLAQYFSFKILNISQPTLGKDVIINPFGSNPTKGKGFWKWAQHLINGVNNSTDIDRILFIVMINRDRLMLNCQVYSPTSPLFSPIKKIVEKNRQLPFVQYRINQSANIEILIFIDNRNINDFSMIFEGISNFKKNYNSEIRPNTYVNVIQWLETTVKLYRVSLN